MEVLVAFHIGIDSAEVCLVKGMCVASLSSPTITAQKKLRMEELLEL
jgi:hypothetical protein